MFVACMCMCVGVCIFRFNVSTHSSSPPPRDYLSAKSEIERMRGEQEQLRHRRDVRMRENTPPPPKFFFLIKKL